MVDKRWQHPAAGSDVGHGFVQVYEELEHLAIRVAKIEKRLYAAPIVVDETAYHPVADLVDGRTVRTMQAANLPTSWEVVDESMNGLPTTNYWYITDKGAVSPTVFGVGGVKKHANIEIQVRAHNEFGAGDGKLDLKLT